MKNFGEQFKKELDDIRVDPELINRTLERVGNETERPEMPVATKRNGIRRVDFLRTAAAIAAAALVTAGVLLFFRDIGLEQRGQQLHQQPSGFARTCGRTSDARYGLHNRAHL